MTNSISISSTTPPTCAHCGQHVTGWRMALARPLRRHVGAHTVTLAGHSASNGAAMIAVVTTFLRWLATAAVVADLVLLVIYYALRVYRAWLKE